MSKVLTQRGVEAARPKAERYGRNDGIVPGLRLIVQPSGTKTFALFARVNGRLVNTRIGDATVLSLAGARQQAKRKLGLIAGGGDPGRSSGRRRRADQETVEVVARRFIERHAKPRLRTWQEIQWRLDARSCRTGASGRSASITRRDVIALLDVLSTVACQ